jgi:hypothetical protein
LKAEARRGRPNAHGRCRSVMGGAAARSATPAEAADGQALIIGCINFGSQPTALAFRGTLSSATYGFAVVDQSLYSSASRRNRRPYPRQF